MMSRGLSMIIVSLVLLAVPQDLFARQGEQSKPPEEVVTEQVTHFSAGRIVTLEEVARAAHPGPLLPLRILSYPFRLVTSGIEKGLISFEKHRLRERFSLWRERLADWGVTPLIGGLGEGTGFGGGVLYTLRPNDRDTLQARARASFQGYQELDLQWTRPTPRGRFVFEGSRQWRPRENFYGLGPDSQRAQRSRFALRQSWVGLSWEGSLTERSKFGLGHKQTWLSALEGRDSRFPSPDRFFEGLPGLNQSLRLRQTALYWETNLTGGEYKRGARVLLGASYQSAMGESKVRYFTYQAHLEGRLPVARERSALVGWLDLALNRERGGSDPLPFYVQPHLGGSSTLRGFPLDRFYGKNALLATLEYRYKIHPNIQAILFFDQGQVFNRSAELRWRNWHRSYGLGIKFKTSAGTVFGIEYGQSREGFQIHITFGDRPSRSLGGLLRHGG
ncbi:MAG: BamA/TamA family outer membrane protein [Acidobacteriota bacterium]